LTGAEEAVKLQLKLKSQNEAHEKDISLLQEQIYQLKAS